MKYTIEFELPDNDIVRCGIKTDRVHWSIYGYDGCAKAEPKRIGKWIARKNWLNAVCSCCSFEEKYPNKFCPNCGADMSERGE